jgi:hypothetical protein
MLTDTPKDILEIQYDLYRKMSPAKKIGLIFGAIAAGRMLSMAGIRMQYRDADEKQIWHIWAKRHLGEELYNKVYGDRKK